MKKFSEIKLLPVNYLGEYKKKLKVDLKKLFAALPGKNEGFQNFDYYLASASAFSSNIEGNSLDFETYLKNKTFGLSIKKKETEEIEDLVEAYTFAQKNNISLENILHTHSIYAKSFISDKREVGKLRKTMVGVAGGGKMLYLAIEPEFVKTELKKLFADIELLLKMKLSFEETFYFAAMIHLKFVNIHPFVDGNGRATRLLEKWFLAAKLGMKAWNIESEKNYFLNRSNYYKNLQLGGNYYTINYDLSIPFLLMLPQSLIAEK
ncbi:MAG: Fic family protein [Bacteroidetes bacterium]|nr:Fic family protein [Bacteroidota bacterium]